MLLLEAAGRAGVATQPGSARPPDVHGVAGGARRRHPRQHGCIGNRVYTDLGDDELHVTVPGRDLARIVAELATIVSANDTLADYHRARRRSLATGSARSSPPYARRLCRRNRVVQGEPPPSYAVRFAFTEESGRPEDQQHDEQQEAVEVLVGRPR